MACRMLAAAALAKATCSNWLVLHGGLRGSRGWLWLSQVLAADAGRFASGCSSDRTGPSTSATKTATCSKSSGVSSRDIRSRSSRGFSTSCRTTSSSTGGPPSPSPGSSTGRPSAGRAPSSNSSSSSSRPGAGGRPPSLLSQFTRDLTDEGRRGLLDPVVGREGVMARTVQVLLRRTKRNPLLIGEAGVGKTAIVEGIAQLMASPKCPRGLVGKRLLLLDVARVVAGTSYRGEFEERLQGLLRELEAAAGGPGGGGGGALLFVDEIHVLAGAGNSEGGLDFANQLKPALARGSLQVLGATTLDEYRSRIEPDPALARRFQPVLVEEPTPEECLLLLRGLSQRYGAFHRVHYADSALAAAVHCAKRYITDRRLPDSAIDLVDEAGAAASLRAPRVSGQQQQQQQQARTPEQQEMVVAAPQASSPQHSSPPPEGQQPGDRGPPGGVAAAAGVAPALAAVQGVPQAANSNSNSSGKTDRSVPSVVSDDADSSSSAAQWELFAAAAQSVGLDVQPALPRDSSSSSSSSGISYKTGSRNSHSGSSSSMVTPAAASSGKAVPSAARNPEATAPPVGPHTTHQQQQQPPGRMSSSSSSNSRSTASLLGPAAAGARAASIARWEDWVAAQGWSGSREAQAQQLLEWFGASPRHPPGVLGHTQTTLERKAKHRALFGSNNSTNNNTSPGASSSTDPLSDPMFDQLPPAVRKALTEAQRLGPTATASQRVDLVPKTCPHCGTLVNAAPTELRLTCPNCSTRFLNISPDKLQLGTTVLLEKQQPWAPAAQQPPWASGQQQVSELSSYNSSSTATASPALGAKRTAVAVLDKVGQPSVDHADAGGTMYNSEPSLNSGAGLEVPGRQAAWGAASQELPMWPEVTDADVFEVVHQALGIPVQQLASTAQLPGSSTSSSNNSSHSAHQLHIGGLVQQLEAAVVGQPEAVAAVAGAMRLLQLGLQPQERPSCSLLFLGPDGVGKTTLAKALAAALLPNEPAAVLQLSMGEFTERHSIARLVGAPPGYVGYGKGGLLTEALRRRPHSVVACDDIDRAHPEVIGLLLQALDSGQLLDSMGHVVSLRSAVLLFTATQHAQHAQHAQQQQVVSPPPQQHASPVPAAGLPTAAVAASQGSSNNNASRAPLQSRSLHSSSRCSSKGQQPAHNTAEQHGQHFSSHSYGSEGAELDEDDAGPAAATAGTMLQGAAAAAAPPQAGPATGTTAAPGASSWTAALSELASRVDDVVQFKQLSTSAVIQIVGRQLAGAAELAALHGVTLEVEAGARQALAVAGFDPARGARRVQKLVRQQVLLPLAEALLTGGAGAAAGESLVAALDEGSQAEGGVGVQGAVGARALSVSHELQPAAAALGSSRQQEQAAAAAGGRSQDSPEVVVARFSAAATTTGLPLSMQLVR